MCYCPELLGRAFLLPTLLGTGSPLHGYATQTRTPRVWRARRPSARSVWHRAAAAVRRVLAADLGVARAPPDDIEGYTTVAQREAALAQEGCGAGQSPRATSTNSSGRVPARRSGGCSCAALSLCLPTPSPPPSPPASCNIDRDCRRRPTLFSHRHRVDLTFSLARSGCLFTCGPRSFTSLP